MGEKDITEKMLEAYNDVFADIVNVLLFNGERIVSPEELEEADPRSRYKAKGKFHELERDILKRVTEGNIHVASIGFENQSMPDPDMPFRVLAYDGTEYMRQKAHNGHVEHPVVTLVLYFNYERPWTYPCSVKEQLKKPNRFEPYYSDYTFNLFQIADLTPEQVQLFQSDFREVADYFVQKKQNGDYKPDLRVVDHMQETLQMLTAVSNDRRFLDAYQPDDPQGVPRTMCDVLDRIENRGIDKGITIGIEKGRKEGRVEGRREGRVEGRQEGRDEVAELMGKLLEQNLLEHELINEIRKASKDKEYRMHLLKEYKII